MDGQPCASLPPGSPGPGTLESLQSLGSREGDLWVTAHRRLWGHGDIAGLDVTEREPSGWSHPRVRILPPPKHRHSSGTCSCLGKPDVQRVIWSWLTSCSQSGVEKHLRQTSRRHRSCARRPEQCRGWLRERVLTCPRSPATARPTPHTGPQQGGKRRLGRRRVQRGQGPRPPVPVAACAPQQATWPWG